MATASKPDKTYNGMVSSVDAKEHVLNVQGYVLSKKFNLGSACTYTFIDKGAGAISDLRPGQKIMVHYQNGHGVLVADRIEQLPLRYEGTVKALDPEKHTLTVHVRGADKMFQIADDCRIALRNDKSGALADIQPGHHVTVTYEIPNNTPTARQIAQTSATFTGTATAVDMTDRTVKAKTFLGTKKFNLADNCAIVLNGKMDGQLKDLKPGDKLVFSYDEINGVNVATRIASVEGSSKGMTAEANQ